MSRRVRSGSWEAVFAPLQYVVIGTLVLFGIVVFVPFWVWLEVRAWLVRQRLRKERLTG